MKRSDLNAFSCEFSGNHIISTSWSYQINTSQGSIITIVKLKALPYNSGISSNGDENYICVELKQMHYKLCKVCCKMLEIIREIVFP